jgi:hypothetical protein
VTDFSRTRAALKVYDDTAGAREANWTKTWAAEDWEAALHVAETADAEAAALVHQAFFEDTKAFNSMDRCKLVGPDDPWLRKLVQ